MGDSNNTEAAGVSTMKKEWNYKDKEAPKINEKFKQFFSTNIKGKNAIKSEGLTAIAHMKGMWKCDCEIIQFPNDQNNWTCICKATIGGYDWDPIEQKVIRVEYTDIGDANVNNCTTMVKASYIRMASTRAIARAMRKYTNIDMVTTDEVNDVLEEANITLEQLTAIKEGIRIKNMSEQVFYDILIKSFGHNDYKALSESQGDRLIRIINSYIPTNTQQNYQKPVQPQMIQPQQMSEPKFSAENLS